ncbi:hypothetical protein dsx2_0525 [Desulfovibrio sp. X2]|uniref:sialidase family protein n=1 Tax=Desulfovibrio sp. X2 TaxID=941449 RepID=UPI0003587292|nr:sialidase family protein [Desulfovibrio sp. X2]EPR38716.1 hypothetical protein dsx2_0525 [Desulfovibrio sp. X2]
MPTIHGRSERHVVIDKRPGLYLSFPDVARVDDRIVCVYRESEGHHHPKHHRLLWRVSEDLGRSFGDARILHPSSGHCPRISLLPGGDLAVVSDGTPPLMAWSADKGRTFAAMATQRLQHALPDRVMERDTLTLLTTAHLHRGSAPFSQAGQAPTEQMVYVSHDRGASWDPLAVQARDACLMLCEASMVRLPDDRLLVLMRENSGVYEPMYYSLGSPDGSQWSEPRPTPLIGHRPTLGLTSAGKLLVTYRSVGPDLCTAAWLGDLSEWGEFAVHGLAPSPVNPRLTDEGLFVANAAGEEACARWALRPITSPVSARAELKLRLRVEEAEEKACCVRFGGIWWSVTPGAIRPLVKGARSVRLPEGSVDLAFAYEPGAKRARVSLRVDGRLRARREVDMDVAARPVIVGNGSIEKDNAGRWLVERMSLSISEPRYGREYRWAWKPDDGLPDAWARANVLELQNARGVWGGDMGYSGWCELPDGSFFCAYHHAVASEPGYRQSWTSWIQGSFFSAEDFAR